jgi:hypothetical protein
MYRGTTPGGDMGCWGTWVGVGVAGLSDAPVPASPRAVWRRLAGDMNGFQGKVDGGTPRWSARGWTAARKSSEETRDPRTSDPP